MSEMVERVARALCDCADEPFDDFSRPKYMADARAAIQAMREPTSAMLVSGAAEGDCDPTCRAAYTAMIDGALK